MALPSYTSGTSFQISRIVRLVLPLGALALLSTVFLFSQNIDPQRAVELSDLDIEELTREPRVGTARFAGVTSDDTSMTIMAKSVRSAAELTEGAPILLRLEAPQGNLEFPSGRIAAFRGDEGQIDQAADVMLLRGDVVLETSDGYLARMPELRAALESTLVQGFGGIEAEGPAGELTADSLEIRRVPGDAGGYLLAFKGNVRLIYVPDD